MLSVSQDYKKDKSFSWFVSYQMKTTNPVKFTAIFLYIFLLLHHTDIWDSLKHQLSYKLIKYKLIKLMTVFNNKTKCFNNFNYLLFDWCIFLHIVKMDYSSIYV